MYCERLYVRYWCFLPLAAIDEHARVDLTVFAERDCGERVGVWVSRSVSRGYVDLCVAFERGYVTV
jgi:hypothetical protein